MLVVHLSVTNLISSFCCFLAIHRHRKTFRVNLSLKSELASLWKNDVESNFVRHLSTFFQQHRWRREVAGFLGDYQLHIKTARVCSCSFLCGGKFAKAHLLRYWLKKQKLDIDKYEDIANKYSHWKCRRLKVHTVRIKPAHYCGE